jgi:Uma2 family endonuclease
MGETEVHRDDMISLIQALRNHFAADPMVCVSGNLLLHYVEGDRRRHVSPDVFVVRGVPKRQRLYYLLWEEGRAPDLVIELTSKSTRKEDLEEKFRLYRDELRVREYVLFDPLDEYLKPSLRGYRLVEGEYVPIDLEDGRLPSEVLGLHLERSGSELRVYDPTTGRWLPTAPETEAALHQAEAALRGSEAARREAEEERDRLRQELEELRGRSSGGPPSH